MLPIAEKVYIARQDLLSCHVSSAFLCLLHCGECVLKVSCDMKHFEGHI